MQLTFDTGAAINGKFPFNGAPGDNSSVLQQGFSIDTMRKIQSSENIRAANTEFFDRDNAAVTVTFTVANLWDTISDAETEAMIYQESLPGTAGTLIMTTVNDKGSKVRYLRNAVIKSVKSINKGVTNYHSIVILGGLISTTAS